MPKVLERSSSDYSFIVWESTEPIEELLLKAALSAEETEKWNAFRSTVRKREWLTVRIVVREMLQSNTFTSISYDENGKPHLPDKGISISHSNQYIAVMISENKHIGIDIEEISTHIERLSQKFLSENEKQSANSAKHIEKLHVMWGAKEVLYKIHSIGNVIFKQDLLVHPFIYTGSGVVTASMLKKGYEKEYTVSYLHFKDYMLAWGLSTPQ